jgi:hypothetical protein
MGSIAIEAVSPAVGVVENVRADEDRDEPARRCNATSQPTVSFAT